MVMLLDDKVIQCLHRPMVQTRARLVCRYGIALAFLYGFSSCPDALYITSFNHNLHNAWPIESDQGQETCGKLVTLAVNVRKYS